ncbi:MAG: chemotaxis response regulator [Pedosphaera sp.]|nr:chemotaxis response regulator [Pedosphaera sp.]
MITNAPKRILVVDGDTDTRQLYFEVLIRSGYKVDTAEDGETGWKALHAASHDPESYDLLITENSMAKSSTVDLIEKLRSERINLPVILASAEAPIKREQFPIAAVLPKPFSPEELVKAVQEVLHTPNNDQA